MSLARTLVLGLIAGGTIFIGLPIGRMKRRAQSLRAFLNAVAIGILLFLIWDVLANAWKPIDAALVSVHDHHGGLSQAIGYGALFALGLAVGLLGLVAYERWSAPSRPVVTHAEGPGAAASTGQMLGRRRVAASPWDPAKRLALLIAVGIGLHNFAEGLAIGQSAARSEVALATLLVIGFGLHNATEGFGIVAPLAADRSAATARPSWGFLALMGLIGGGPTVLGTVVGHGFASDAMSIVFLTLAAGSIIYVVIQLLGVAAKFARQDLLALGILAGLLAGFVTDAVVSAGGA